MLPNPSSFILSPALAWGLLFAAGALEISWAVGLKFVDGFNRPLVLLLTLGCMGASVVLLALAMGRVPLGVAYAVWSAIGIAGTALVGMWCLGEAASLLRLGSIALILVGVVGLKLSV